MSSHGDTESHHDVEPNLNDPNLADHLSVESDTTSAGNNQTEPDTSDRDSALGDINPRESLDSTVSVTSSIIDYPIVNERRYHKYKEGRYLLPNDETEQDRLDLQHHIFDLTLGDKLYLAPIVKPQKVLDIGTGTGIWAIEFADKHPEAFVRGTDLSLIQPIWVPPNVQFEINDAEDKWDFSYKFNYVHWRMLVTAFKSHAKVIQSAFEFLEPNGYLELQDAELPFQSDDGTLDGTDLKKWGDTLVDCATDMGKDWCATSQYKRYMLEAGFVDVQEKRYQWPINRWQNTPELRKLGDWCQEDLDSGLEAFSLGPLTRSRNFSKEQVLAWLVSVRKDIRNTSIHAYIPIVVVYGRKPTAY